LLYPQREPAETAVTPRPIPTPVPGFADLRIRLALVTPLKQPVAMAVRKGDPALYIATKDGRVHAVHDGRSRVVLDIRHFVKTEGEAGLLGIAFSPSGNRLIVDYVKRDGNSEIRSWPFRDKARTGGVRMLLIEHPDLNFHHSGTLAFGPDNYLYISHGDGGLPRDPKNRAQSMDVLLGKILRVESRASGKYGIPKDNPFVGREGVRPEIWAMGLRNPWKFSFDRKRGDLWIADVGLTKFEEINLEPRGSGGGKNYGWSFWEGLNPIKPSPPPGLVGPVHQYERANGHCAIIGGYVYRGTKIPGLRGAYLFGDLCKGRIEALRLTNGKARPRRVLQGIVDQLTSFGQDLDGELYVMSLNDGVYRIEQK
jgi:glucose/arabinose dehydrogenase